jgi:hypothetical protein
VASNTSTVYATEWFEFPRYACKPPSGDTNNAYLAHGFCGGLVLKNPHLATLDEFTFALEAPPNMQYFDYYDADTKAHLYVATDDEDGWRKRWDITGDQVDTVVIGLKHYFPNPRRAHNGAVPGVMPFTVPYTVSMELFRGKTADGRCGCYDSALRYRTWATHSDRSWMANGPWMDDPDVSDRVKDSDLYYVRLKNDPAIDATEWSTIVEDMDRLKTFVGATHMLGLLYGWAENMHFAGTFLPPAFDPLAQPGDLDTALGTAAAANIHLSSYTIPQWWDNALTGAGFAPWRFDDFIGTIDYNAISQYVIRDKDNIVLTVPQDGPHQPPSPTEPLP